MNLCGCYELGLDVSIKAVFLIFFLMMPETMYLLNIMKYVFMKAWADTIMTQFLYQKFRW